MDESTSPPLSRGSRFANFVRRFYARACQRLHAYRHELVIFTPISAGAFCFLLPTTCETLLAPTVPARPRHVIGLYRPGEVVPENRLKKQNGGLESVRFELNNRFN